MKAIILAGGKGTRLYPVTLETPKPLLTVNKKPILNYLVELFFKHGVEDIGITINVDHTDDFDWWYKRYWEGAPIRFFEETAPLGTFGTLALVAHWIKGEDFFVSNGDELKDFDLSAMETYHKAHDAPATVALISVPNPKDYGVARIDNHLITEFLEKPENPPSSYISAGLYCLSADIFDYYTGANNGFAMLERDLFPHLAKEKKLHGFTLEGKWQDCGTFERWQKAMEEWKGEDKSA